MYPPARIQMLQAILKMLEGSTQLAKVLEEDNSISLDTHKKDIRDHISLLEILLQEAHLKGVSEGMLY